MGSGSGSRSSSKAWLLYWVALGSRNELPRDKLPDKPGKITLLLYALITSHFPYFCFGRYANTAVNLVGCGLSVPDDELASTIKKT